MKKIMLAGLSVALLLVSCGGSGSKTVTPKPNPTPTPTPNPTSGAKTLYQGVWSWAIVDPSTRDAIDEGTVIYNDEAKASGRTVAVGGYINEAKSKQGLSLLGPITEGELVAYFSLGESTDSDPYFVGVDEDNALEDYQGHPAFGGGGAIVDKQGNTKQEVLVALVQESDTVPTSSVELNKVKAQAKTLAAQMAKTTSLKAMSKTNPAVIKALAASINR